jgi:hypothetical protein
MVLLGKGLLVVGDFLVQVGQLLLELVVGINPLFAGVGFEKATINGDFLAPEQGQFFAQ